MYKRERRRPSGTTRRSPQQRPESGPQGLPDRCRRCRNRTPLWWPRSSRRASRSRRKPRPPKPDSGDSFTTRSTRSRHQRPPRFGCFIPAFVVSRGPCIGWKQCQGQRPPCLPPQPVGQEPTRDATRRVLPKLSAEQGPVVRIVVVRLLLFLRNPTFDPQWRQGDDLVELPASPSQADGDTAARSRETRCHEKETPRKRG